MAQARAITHNPMVDNVGCLSIVLKICSIRQSLFISINVYFNVLINQQIFQHFNQSTFLDFLISREWT